MRSGPLFTAVSAMMLAATVASAAAGPHIRRGPTAPRGVRSHATSRVKAASATRAGMAPERATELQSALIKAGYMTGTPSGTWDASSQAAMEKLQADNGWQTKLVPDSRAIIKLGLGPNASVQPTGTSFSASAEPNSSSSAMHTANQ